MTRFARCVVGILLAGAAVALLWESHVAILRTMAWWLNVGERPHRADYVMVLTGGEQTRPFAAAALIGAHFADRALIARVKPPPEPLLGTIPDDLEMNRRVLVACGVDPSRILVLPGAARITYDEAKALAGFLDEHPGASVLVVTSDFHTRRSRWVFQRVLGQRASQLTFVSAPTDEFDMNFWWRDQRGMAVIGSEYLKLAVYLVWYGHFCRWFAACVTLTLVAHWAAKTLRRREIASAPAGNGSGSER